MGFFVISDHISDFRTISAGFPIRVGQWFSRKVLPGTGAPASPGDLLKYKF